MNLREQLKYFREIKQEFNSEEQIEIFLING